MTIFALDTDDLGLTVFANERDAVSHCEGIDVEDGVWRFWDASGAPLKARFDVPNEKGRFCVASGRYHLEADQDGEHLLAVLDQASYIQDEAGLIDTASIRTRLITNRRRRRVMRVSGTSDHR